MKPYLILLAICLAAVKPVLAQTNETQPTLLVNQSGFDTKEDHARLDTGIVSVTISWNGWPCQNVQVNILPAGQPGAPPIASKWINVITTGCFNNVAFGGITAGTQVTAEVIISTGLRGYSASGYVGAGWPPLFLEVELPN
ncbi:hypothetical protein F0L74_09400 [Chitinophaga agrisoli]|uniref:Uncharacterized protein n=1 Tax=Chitinophaga agrisoli TaxID=2607653 RepID=A0A5B2VWP7_9BACT|nr:hypothetical protein [Chitinophaga agrisoli]KAA2242732.1 hypothetical protein F0L74_09400 [Chitinophaga agrisoli]